MDRPLSATWDKKLMSNWTGRMRLIHESAYLSDCKIIVSDGKPKSGKKEYPCHRVFLETASPVFHNLLQNSKAKNIIPVANVTPQIMEKILKYIYMDDFSIPDLEEALEFLNPAMEYCIYGLIQLLTPVVVDNLHVENALRILQLVYQRRDFVPEIFTKALEIVCRDADALVDSKEFDELSETCLSEIIRRDDLQVCSELQLYHAVFRWGESACVKLGLNPEANGNVYKVLQNVIQHIRFPLLDPVDFTFIVGTNNNDLLNMDDKLAILLYFNVSKEKRSTISTGRFRSVPRYYRQDMTMNNEDASLSVMEDNDLAGIIDVGETPNWSQDTMSTWNGRLRAIMESEYLCDCKIILDYEDGNVPTKVFHCHRIFLESASPVFCKMLQSSSPSNNPGKAVMHFSDLKPNTMERILAYVYHEDINSPSPLVLLDDLLEFLVVGMQYSISGIENHLGPLIVKNINTESVLIILETTMKWKNDFPQVVVDSLDVICRNAHLLLGTPEFLDLSEECVIEIIQCDELDVPSELFVFNAVRRWGEERLANTLVDNTESTLTNILKNVVAHVRFLLMEPGEFALNVGIDNQVLSAEDKVQILLRFSTVGDKRCTDDQSKFSCKPRNPIKEVHNRDATPNPSTNPEVKPNERPVDNLTNKNFACGEEGFVQKSLHLVNREKVKPRRKVKFLRLYCTDPALLDKNAGEKSSMSQQECGNRQGNKKSKVKQKNGKESQENIESQVKINGNVTTVLGEDRQKVVREIMRTQKWRLKIPTPPQFL